MAFDTSATSIEFSPHPERDSRCVRHRVDDPLTQHLRGIKFPGLRPGVWLNNQTVNLFDEFRGQDLEKLKSVFVEGQGLNGSVWIDISESCSYMVDGVARYDGLPLDGVALRVMDIHNHPAGYPNTASYEDDLFFLKDQDLRVQAVVSDEGTLLMSKKNNVEIDEEENASRYEEFRNKYPEDPGTRDKEYNLWLAKRYNLDLLWLSAGSKFLKKFK